MDKRWQRVFTLLSEMYPDARCELNYETPFELLIATILSAQCTDQRVNIITPRLFQRFRSPEDYLEVSQDELEDLIRTCGLYRNKARSIIGCCRVLVRDFQGVVPRDLVSLESLPGVGRKTAAVVASNAFGVPALAVDTHVFRVARRIGLARGDTPEKVEAEVCAIYPREQWIELHHILIWHGRRLCHARKPDCEQCPLAADCDQAISGSAREVSV
jgi:endonuclease-3